MALVTPHNALGPICGAIALGDPVRRADIDWAGPDLAGWRFPAPLSIHLAFHLPASDKIIAWFASEIAPPVVCEAIACLVTILWRCDGTT